MGVVAVVLAAGDSHRMGTDKLALPVGEHTVLEAAVLPLLEASRIGHVLVVRKPGATLPEKLAGCRVVECLEHAEGMGASLRAGVAAAGTVDWLLLSLGDLPSLSSETVESVLDAALHHPGRIVVPVYGGRRGHPVAFPGRLRDALLQVRGDVGARDVVRSAGDDVVEVVVDDPGTVADVDSPADLNALRAGGAFEGRETGR